MTINNGKGIKAHVASVGFARPSNSHSYPLGRARLFGVYCSSFRVLQLFSELLILNFIFYNSLRLTGMAHSVGSSFLSTPFTLSFFLSIVLVVCVCCMGLYSSKQSVAVSDVLHRLSLAFLFSLVVIATVFWIMQWHSSFVEILAAPLAVAFVVLLVGRLATTKLVGRESILKKVLILGDGDRANHVFERLYDFSGSAYSLHRLTITDTGKDDLGDQIRNFVSENDITEIVLAYQEKRQTLPVSALLECKLSGICVRDPIEFLERESGLIDFDFLDLGWMVFSDGFNSDGVGRILKRTLDLVGSLVLLIISLPLFLLAAAAIKLDKSGAGPIFYHQKRVGLDGKLFDVWKFRSMYTNAESDGKAKWAVENDSRVTAAGAILRKYRIDELPQLFNVIRGDMSLVGPRPERPEFVAELSEMHVLYGDRHRVKPGLTGWAQMKFPYTSSKNDSIKKLQYDMYYVKNRSLLLDFLILLQTVEVVLCGKGAR